MEINVKNCALLTISTIIAVLMVTSVLVPSLETAEDSRYTTYANNVSGHTPLKLEETVGDHTLTFDKTQSYYVVDGVEYPLSAAGDFVLVSDSFSVFIQGGSTVTTLINTNLNTRLSGTYSMSLTISNSAISGTVGSASVSSSCTYLYLSDVEGDYFTTYGGTYNLYVNSVNDITTVYNKVAFHNGKAWYNASEGELVAPLVQLKDNVYTLKNTDTYVKDASNHTANVFLAPVSVIGYDAHQDSTFALVEIIPLLFMVGIVIGVVGVTVGVLRNRD